MSTISQPVCFSSSGSDHFSTSARSILSFLNGVCFIRPKLSLFYRPPTLLFKDSFILIKYPFIHVKSLHSFQSMFLPGDYHEVGQEFQVHHSSLFFFSGGFNSSFRCWSYPFPRFKCFSMSVHLLVVHLYSYPECSRYLRRIMFPFLIHSSYFEVFLSFKL